MSAFFMVVILNLKKKKKKKTTSTAIPPSSASQLLFTISLSPRDNNGIERKTPSLGRGVCEFHQGYF